MILVKQRKENIILPAKKHQNISADIAAINSIPIIPKLLDVICRTTGMGFAAIARVTEEQWVTCTTKDSISFGLEPGDELEIGTTLCNVVRQSNQPIFIDNVAKDAVYSSHPIPAMYGIQSYISVPIYKKDGSFFGTICAVDPEPSKVKTEEIKDMFSLFADLISFHLETVLEKETTAVQLAEERENSELREQFIAILGHDLRNPIATTRMSAEILLKFSKDELVQRNASMIKSTSLRMDALIENILDFARGRLGEGIQLKPVTNTAALEKALQQVLNEIKAISAGRKITTKLVLKKAITCDINRITQLFSNILGNAVSHGAEDSPIKVNAVIKEGFFNLSVANAGEKIPETAMKHLFQPFYRQDVKPGKQGLGLGLFIASEIAKAHKGKLEVASSDKETCFTFTMPVA